MLLVAEAHCNAWKSCGGQQHVMEQRDGYPGEAGPGKKQLEQCVVVYMTIQKQYRNGKKKSRIGEREVVFCNPLCLNGKIKVFIPA